MYGARPLKRAINRYVLNPLSVALIKGDVKEDSILVISKSPTEEKLYMASRPKEDQTGSDDSTTAAAIEA